MLFPRAAAPESGKAIVFGKSLFFRKEDSSQNENNIF